MKDQSNQNSNWFQKQSNLQSKSNDQNKAKLNRQQHYYTPEQDQIIIRCRNKGYCWYQITSYLNQRWNYFNGTLSNPKKQFKRISVIARFLRIGHNHQQGWKTWKPQIIEAMLKFYAQIGGNYSVIISNLPKLPQNQRYCQNCVKLFIRSIIYNNLKNIQDRVMDSKYNVAKIKQENFRSMLSKLLTSISRKFTSRAKKLREQLIIYVKCRMKNIQVPLQKVLQFYEFLRHFAQLTQHRGALLHQNYKQKVHNWSKQQTKAAIQLYKTYGHHFSKLMNGMFKLFGVSQRYQTIILKIKLGSFINKGKIALEQELNKIGQSIDVKVTFGSNRRMVDMSHPNAIQNNVNIIKMHFQRQKSYDPQYLIGLKNYYSNCLSFNDPKRKEMEEYIFRDHVLLYKKDIQQKHISCDD